MAGLLVMSAGLLALSRLGDSAPVWAIAVVLLVTGLGSSFFEPANASAIMGSVPRDRLSSAAASITASRQVSQSIGFTLGGALFALREESHLNLGSSASTAVVAAFNDAMLVASGICLMGVAVAYLRGCGIWVDPGGDSPIDHDRAEVV